MIIKLNVGGRTFHTSAQTLTWVPHTFFTALLSNNLPSEKDDNGAYFIDRDPDLFKIILKYLRTRKFTYFESRNFSERLNRKEILEVLHEAEFYGIIPLIEKLYVLKNNFLAAVNLENSSTACGDIHFTGTIPYANYSTRESADQTSKRNFSGQAVQSICSIHNYIAVAYKTHALVYRYSDLKAHNFELIYKTRPCDIQKITLNVKKKTKKLILATASERVITLWLLDEIDDNINTDDNSSDDETVALFGNRRNTSTQQPIAQPNDPQDITYVRNFQLADTCDKIMAMEFVCGNLVVLANANNATIIAVWNSVNQQWLQQILCNTSRFTSWQLNDLEMVVFGTESGELKTIDMEKLPRRVHDSTLMINDLAIDAMGRKICSVSAHTSELDMINSNYFYIEVAYGTDDGRVVILVEQRPNNYHPRNRIGDNILSIAFSSQCHQKPVNITKLTTNYLISVCSDNHVRTFQITRFRGKLSNQAKPLSSFDISPVISIESQPALTSVSDARSHDNQIYSRSLSQKDEEDQASSQELDENVNHEQEDIDNVTLGPTVLGPNSNIFDGLSSKSKSHETDLGQELNHFNLNCNGHYPRIDESRTEFNPGPHILVNSAIDAIFVQQTCQHYSNELYLRIASTGQRLCKLKAVKDKTNISTFCIMNNLHSSSGRLSCPNRHLLLSGHNDGHIEIWDLEPSIDKFSKNSVLINSCPGNKTQFFKNINNQHIQLQNYARQPNDSFFSLPIIQEMNGPTVSDLLRHLDRLDNLSLISDSERNSLVSQFSYDV